MLLGATVVFLMAVQCGIWMRAYTTIPTEISDWWPGVADEKLVNIQRLHRRGYRIWDRRFRATYRGGILLLLLGLGAALVPKGSITWGRGIALGVAVGGLAIECVWIAANYVLARADPWAIDDTVEPPPKPPSRLQRSPALQWAARVVIPLVKIRRRASPAPPA